jgi:hypothetical protein
MSVRSKMIMNKIAIIAFVFFTLDVESPAQLNTFSGELRYQHQYQDILSGDNLSTTVRRNPLLNLGGSGDIFSRNIGQFFASTALNGSFSDARAGEYAIANRQFLWDYYNLLLILLPNSLVQFNLRAREGMLESKTEFGASPLPITTARKQEYGFTASTNKLRFLPSTSFTYQQSREWSLTNEPYDRLNNTYSLSLATSGGGSSITMSGNVNERINQFSQARERDYNLVVNGTKDFNETDKLDLSSEFERYGAFSTLSGSVAYGGTLSERMNMFSSLGGRNSSSPNYSLRYLNTSHGLHIKNDEHFQTTLNVSAKTGSELFTITGSQKKNTNYDWNFSSGLSHGRALSFGTISNSISLGIGQQRYDELRHNYSVSFGNGLQTKVGGFRVTANQNFSFNAIHNDFQRYEVGNSARGTIDGMIWHRIKSQTVVDYHNQRYTGTLGAFRNRKTFQVREMLNSSFYYFIPFSVGVGGTVSWYLGERPQKSYSWNLTFSSNRFFVSALSVTYRYHRSFDLYYGRLVVEQSADIRYQWRALRFEVNLRESKFVNRRREVIFTVSRPF